LDVQEHQDPHQEDFLQVVEVVEEIEVPLLYQVVVEQVVEDKVELLLQLVQQQVQQELLIQAVVAVDHMLIQEVEQVDQVLL
jgi:hypothetical protein